MKRSAALLLALTALVAAGCGGSSKNDSSSSSSSPASAPTTSTSSGGGGGKTVVIAMKNIAFKPQTVTVKVGDTVKWENQDSAPHDVVGGPIKSNTFGNGGSFTYKPTKAGKISYVCTIHPGMAGVLNVTS
jgi:plastocyanin